MITTMYPPETGWIAVRHAELVAVAQHHRRARAGRNPRTLTLRRPRALDQLRVWTPNMNRMERTR
ncbi:MAG TPA: hypothetical protein VFZ85_08020 [Jiangellaceae bacterium]